MLCFPFSFLFLSLASSTILFPHIYKYTYIYIHLNLFWLLSFFFLFPFLRLVISFFVPSTLIAQMVIAGGFFFFLFFCTDANHSMVIGGGGFFRPLSQSPRWRLAVRGLFLFSAMPTFLFNSFRLCPLFFSIPFGYAHILNLFSGDALFSVFFFLLCFLFSPL